MFIQLFFFPFFFSGYFGSGDACVCIVSVGYHYNYYSLHASFSRQRLLGVFHWSLSDNNSPQVSRTFWGVLVYLFNVMVWMVSILLLISKSSTLFSKPLLTVPDAPTVSPSPSCSTVFFCFSLVLWPCPSIFFFIFSLSFILTQWSSGTAKSTKWQDLFSC